MAVAVRIKATVINIVEGQPVPEPIADETTAPPVAKENQGLAVTTSPDPPPVGEVAEANWLDSIDGLSTNLVIIIAAAVVFIGLVTLAISMARRKKRGYY